MKSSILVLVLASLYVFCCSSFCLAFEIVIDTEQELAEVEGSIKSTCEYQADQNLICKAGTRDAGSTGFWSSCDERGCEITVEVGKLGGLGRIPSSVSVLAHVEGTDAQLRFRAKFDVDDPLTNLIPIAKSEDWQLSEPYDLTDAVRLNPQSLFIFRLGSGPLDTSVDVLDKMIFAFEDETTASTESTTSQESSEPTTEPTQENTEPTEQKTELSEQTTEPVHHSTETDPAEETTKSVEQSTGPVQETTEPVDQTTEPAQQTTAQKSESTEQIDVTTEINQSSSESPEPDSTTTNSSFLTRPSIALLEVLAIVISLMRVQHLCSN